MKALVPSPLFTSNSAPRSFNSVAPFAGMEDIFDVFDHTFNFDTLKNSKATNFPPHNITEEVEHGLRKYTIEFALAGYKRSDVKLTRKFSMSPVPTTTFYLTGETEKEEDKVGVKKIHHGISRKKFSVQLPFLMKMEIVETTFEDGILTLVVKEVLPEDDDAETITF